MLKHEVISMRFQGENKIGFTKSIVLTFFSLLVVIGAFFLVLTYSKNIKNESAELLLEINSQISKNIEENINYSWNIADSIKQNLEVAVFKNDDAFLSYLNKLCTSYDISNIIIYNEEGYSFSADGRTKPNDLASDLLYQARKNDGKNMYILKSSIAFTITYESNLILHNSKIAGLSVIKNLDGFLKTMNIASYDGDADIYLTEENGLLISQLTPHNENEVFNVNTLLENKNIQPILCTHKENCPSSFKEDGVWYVTDALSSTYVTHSNIHVINGIWRLFYFVDNKVVNGLTTNFSLIVAALCVIVLIAFLLLGGIFYTSMYRKKMLQYTEEIKSRNKMMDLMVSNTQNAFVLTSMTNLQNLYTSENLEEILGVSDFKIIAKDGKYQLTDSNDHVNSILANLNTELLSWDGVSEFLSKHILYKMSKQEDKYFIMHLYPTGAGKGECLAIFSDVTRDKKREEELVLALKMADSANRAKTQFLSNMSHDIRTPMNAILNMTDFAIENANQPIEQSKYLNTIKNSANHLLHLINDILDMSRIESGRTLMEEAPFEITVAVNEVCEMIHPLCLKKDIMFTARYDDIQYITLLGDKLKLNQILINILNNAVKFTKDKGKISLLVHPVKTAQKDCMSLRFVIEDNGIGMSKEFLKHIFEPFTRSENANANQIEGTGLGLSICKSFITAMGGTIECQSTLQVGSKFTIEIPFKIAKTKIIPKHTSVSTTQDIFNGKNALVCEDHKLNQEISKRILEKLGFRVDIADDGEIGADKFLNSNDHYDIIYMDIQMPNMNGYVATYKIRESAHPQAKSIPIVAMTANVFAEDVEKAKLSGMDGHISKPLVIDEIVQVTSQILQEKEQEQNP